MRIIVNIDVPELAPAIDFYSNAFDLELNRILDDGVAAQPMQFRRKRVIAALERIESNLLEPE